MHTKTIKLRIISKTSDHVHHDQIFMESKKETIDNIFKKITKNVIVNEEQYKLTRPNTAERLSKETTLEVLAKSNTLDLWFVNDPNYCTKVVEFPDNNEVKWGFSANLDSHWSNWKVLTIEDGLFAKKKKIKINDRFWAMNGREINEENHKDIYEVLKEGKSSSVTFKIYLEPKYITFHPGPLDLGRNCDKITEVFADGQADAAGVRPGWKILKIDDLELSNILKKGDAITDALKIEKRKNNIIILFQPDWASLESLKIVQLKPGPVGFRRDVDIITAIQPKSQAANAGICVGWKITKINGITPVFEESQMKLALNKAKEKDYKLEFDFRKEQAGKFPSGVEVEIPYMENVWVAGKIIRLGSTHSTYKVQWYEGGKYKNKVVEESNIRKMGEKFLIEVTFQPHKSIGILRSKTERSRVIGVRHGSQADILCVCEGWNIYKINGVIISVLSDIRREIQRTHTNNQETVIVFEKPVLTLHVMLGLDEISKNVVRKLVVQKDDTMEKIQEIVRSIIKKEKLLGDMLQFNDSEFGLMDPQSHVFITDMKILKSVKPELGMDIWICNINDKIIDISMDYGSGTECATFPMPPNKSKPIDIKNRAIKELKQDGKEFNFNLSDAKRNEIYQRFEYTLDRELTNHIRSSRPIMMSGFLDIRAGTECSWRPRYFELRLNCLIYFFDMSDTLADGKIVLPQPSLKIISGEHNQFSIKTVNRTHHLRARTKNEQNRWINILRSFQSSEVSRNLSRTNNNTQMQCVNNPCKRINSKNCNECMFCTCDNDNPDKIAKHNYFEDPNKQKILYKGYLSVYKGSCQSFHKKSFVITTTELTSIEDTSSGQKVDAIPLNTISRVYRSPKMLPMLYKREWYSKRVFGIQMNKSNNADRIFLVPCERETEVWIGFIESYMSKSTDKSSLLLAISSIFTRRNLTKGIDSVKSNVVNYYDKLFLKTIFTPTRFPVCWHSCGLGQDERQTVFSIQNEFKISRPILCDLSKKKYDDDDAVIISQIIKVNTRIALLDISENNIRLPGAVAIWKAMVNNTTLTSIDLSNNMIGEGGSSSLVSAFCDTRHVSIATINNGIAWTKNNFVERVKKRTSADYYGVQKGWHVIKINGEPIPQSQSAEEIMRDLAKEKILMVKCVFEIMISKLKTLKLAGNSLGDRKAMAVSIFLGLTSTLTSLDLAENGIGCVGIHRIAESLKTNTSLKILDVSHNIMKDEGAGLLSDALLNNTTLSILNIQKNNVCKGGAKKLADVLKKNKTLTYLTLSNNEIGDDGFILISEALCNNATLKRLYVFNNSIADDGAKKIAASFETNTTLELLSLNQNNIGDDGANEIADSLENVHQRKKGIRSLFLSSNKITQKVKIKLKKIEKKSLSLQLVTI